MARMTLEQVIEVLMNKGMTTDEAIENIQRSYDFIIQHIRLTQSAHPIRFNRAFKLTEYGDSDNYGVIKSAQSEICFKEVLSYLKTDSAISYTDFYNLDKLSVGRFESENYGWSDLAIVNQNHSGTPKLYQIGNVVVNTEFDDTFTILQGYAYPYFCKTERGEHVDRHRYDIKWMHDKYGSSSLTVDNMLYPLVALGANGRYGRDIGDMQKYDQCRRTVAMMLNIFNYAPASPRIDNWSSIGKLKADSIKL